jgi:hypothetical protein
MPEQQACKKIYSTQNPAKLIFEIMILITIVPTSNSPRRKKKFRAYFVVTFFQSLKRTNIYQPKPCLTTTPMFIFIFQQYIPVVLVT